MFKASKPSGNGPVPSASSASSAASRHGGDTAGSGDSNGDDTLLDLDSTLHRLGGDRNLLACLAEVFSEDAPVLLQRLSTAVASMNGEEIRASAHALRGLAANFGAQSLTQRLRQLEEIGARNDLERAQHLLSEVDQQTDQLRSTLKEHC